MNGYFNYTLKKIPQSDNISQTEVFFHIKSSLTTKI